MSFVPIVLPRFSGSTLEPTVEPLVIYPQQHEHKPLPSNDPLQPTRRTQSLKRKNKPTLITIPTVCKEFVPQEPDNEDYSPWSYEEDNEPGLLWDDVSQTITSASQHTASSLCSFHSDITSPSSCL